MDPRRPLLLAAGAAICLLAALPATLSSADSERPAPVEITVLDAAYRTAQVGLPGSTTTVQTSQQYDGISRSFVLHVPDGLLAPAPLVVALHAHSHSPDRIRTISRFERLADRHGFVVAFPGGAGGSWNAGTCCPPGSRQDTDDVAFLDEVVALARTKAPVDAGRISFAGGSNGGMMALRYACERSEVVASVAVVAGPLLADCTPSGPVAVLALHGADDAVVPLAGGRNETFDLTFPGLDASLQPFRDAGGTVEITVVRGVGHTWMTQYQHGFDASGAIWDWIRDHPQPL